MVIIRINDLKFKADSGTSYFFRSIQLQRLQKLSRHPLIRSFCNYLGASLDQSILCIAFLGQAVCGDYTLQTLLEFGPIHRVPLTCVVDDPRNYLKIVYTWSPERSRTYLESTTSSLATLANEFQDGSKSHRQPGRSY